MLERKKFGALGWNSVYDFTQVDHQLSQYVVISIFKDLCRQVADPADAGGSEDVALSASQRTELEEKVP